MKGGNPQWDLSYYAKNEWHKRLKDQGKALVVERGGASLNVSDNRRALHPLCGESMTLQRRKKFNPYKSKTGQVGSADKNSGKEG